MGQWYHIRSTGESQMVGLERFATRKRTETTSKAEAKYTGSHERRGKMRERRSRVWGNDTAGSV